MDASPAARRIAFAVIVCVFVALGAYLLGPVAHRGSQAAGTPAAAGSSGPAAGSSGPAAASRSAAAATAPVTGRPDIYQWLPFTPAGLAAAAATVIRFGNAYGTYSYTDSGAAYAASLQSITSPQLVSQIEDAYQTPGVAATRQSQKLLAVATTRIGSIRGFGPGSLTFVVEVTQQISDSSGHRQQTTGYAVTVSGSGQSWQVTDVELASAGNS